MRNIRVMHLLERIAARCNQAGIDVMALGGAALHLLPDTGPETAPMSGLDIMVRIGHAHETTRLLEDLGCVRSEVRCREDLFPKYDNAVEFTAGSIDPVPVNLHVRPFRPARYARLVPDDALWQRAETVNHGGANVLTPSHENLLVYLAMRSAIGGNARLESLTEIKRLIRSGGPAIDWNRFLNRVDEWRLGLPIRSAVTATEIAVGQVCPPEVRRRLAAMPAGRRDRIALRHAAQNSVIVTLLTAPGWLYRARFLRDVVFHDRTLHETHMQASTEQ